MSFSRLSLNVGPISPEATHPLRSRVLRSGRPLANCVFEGDNEPSSFHLGALLDGEIIGICSLMQRPSPNATDPGLSYQLRGMAVSPEHRGLGTGAALLNSAEQYLKQMDVVLVWMNAREHAVSFYQRHGYEKKGTLFEIEGIGPHYYMHKYLNHET